MKLAKFWLVALLVATLAACGSDDDPNTGADASDVDGGDDAQDVADDIADDDAADDDAGDGLDDDADDADDGSDDDADDGSDDDADDAEEDVEPPDEVPPVLPDNPYPSISDITARSFNASWDPSEDETSEVVTYKLFLVIDQQVQTSDEAEALAAFSDETTETEASFDGLTPGTVYVLHIFATDEAGNEAGYSPTPVATEMIPANSVKQLGALGLEGSASAMFAIERRTVIIGLYSGHILRSTDGGETFEESEEALSSPIQAFAAAPSSLGVYGVGKAGALFESSDGGESWEPIETGISTDLTAIATFGVDSIYVGGADGSIHFSEDSGETWEELDDVSFDSTILGISADEDGRLTVVSNEAEIYVRNSEGEPANPITGGMYGLNAFYAPVPFYFFVGGESASLYRYAGLEEGVDWQSYELPEWVEEVCAIWVQDEETFWFADSAGSVGKTDDGGDTFERFDVEDGVTAFFGVDANQLYILTEGGTLHRSFYDPELDEDDDGNGDDGNDDDEGGNEGD